MAAILVSSVVLGIVVGVMVTRLMGDDPNHEYSLSLLPLLELEHPVGASDELPQGPTHPDGSSPTTRGRAA